MKSPRCRCGGFPTIGWRFSSRICLRVTSVGTAGRRRVARFSVVICNMLQGIGEESDALISNRATCTTDQTVAERMKGHDIALIHVPR